MSCFMNEFLLSIENYFSKNWLISVHLLKKRLG